MNAWVRWLLTMTAATVLVAPGHAQPAERQATFKGGGDSNSGKCTIEVYVDDSAEVEIRGDRAFLRTLTGQRAQWRRFECSGPMPRNPSEFRFQGIDGRGLQELVQDPRNGRGVAIIGIHDPKGGAEGYTFDIEWRGRGFASGPADRPMGGRDRWDSPRDAVRTCRDAVRDRANQQYGLRDIDFRDLDANDNRGRNDRVVGSFNVRRGDYRDTYQFSCMVDPANGRVREVNIVQERGGPNVNRGRNDAASACQRAAERRIQDDGYRDVQIGPLRADNSRNGRLAGTARAHRRNSDRAYDFEVRCSVDLQNGSLRSVDVDLR
jgi:hypothetical protein